MSRPRSRGLTPAVVVALALAGCGSSDAVDLPPAAGPDVSPTPSAEPAGRVAPVAEAPEHALALVYGAERGIASAAGRRFALDRDAGELVAIGTGERVRTAAEPVGLAAYGGDTIAVVSGRERVLELYDARTLKRTGRRPAGAGPTNVVAGSRRIYVVDTTGDGLLAFRVRPELALDRRVALPGAPYGLAVDPERGRLWSTLTATNELVELAAGTRPRVLRSLPTVRQPDAVAVEPGSGLVVVAGRADGVLQLLRLSR